MKVVVTGCTGFIGGEVLDQCLQEPSITSVVALSRRDLPASITNSNPKLKVVIMDDFASYPEPVLREIEGSNACLWALGKALASSDEEARKISLDYTFAATKAFSEIKKRDGIAKFRFVYLSGRIAERDQTKSLWYMEKHRRIKGQLESDLISFAEKSQNAFETYIMKPSMVLTKDNSIMNFVSSSLIATVKVDTLARAMIRIATEGYTQNTFENSDIVSVGS